MSDLIQKNIIVVLGDLGAGINFVKNILLLSPDVDFPWKHSGSRFDFIVNSVYPSFLTARPDQWINLEYKLRRWDYFYSVDIADRYQDINTYQVRRRSSSNKIVFISHWPEIAAKLKAQYPDINIVSLYAETSQDVEWQVSMYIEKLGIKRMHNFSFNGDIEQQRKEYIAEHGEQAYQMFNALNMYEVMLQRKDSYFDPDYHIVKISQLQNDSWIEELVNKLGLTLDLEQARALAAKWRCLNPVKTKQWSN